MNTSIKQAFSEMAERTKVTEWDSKLLHANAVTMRRNSRRSLRSLLDMLDETNSNAGETMNWCETAEAIGYVLIVAGAGFDPTVKRMVRVVRDSGFDSDTLADDIELEMLKGVEQYCRIYGEWPVSSDEIIRRVRG